MKIYFALKRKDVFEFICISESQIIYEKRINQAYYNWKMMQGKSAIVSLDDFMIRYDKVKITIEEIE